MDTSFHKGWLVSNVCSVAMLLFAKWCILKQFCFVRLLATWLWALDSFTIKFWLSFAPCMCVFSIVRCVYEPYIYIYIICFVVGSFTALSRDAPRPLPAESGHWKMLLLYALLPMVCLSVRLLVKKKRSWLTFDHSEECFWCQKAICGSFGNSQNWTTASQKCKNYRLYII